MAFGGRANAEQSVDMVKAFLDRGHKQVDTAFMYMDGKSETIIGGMNLPKTGSSSTLGDAPPGSRDVVFANVSKQTSQSFTG